MTSLESIRQMIEMAGIQPTLYQFKVRHSPIGHWFDVSASEAEAMKKSDINGDYQFRALYSFEEES